MPRRDTERYLRPDSSQWVVQALTRLVCTYAIVQGLFIINGGRQRWNGPAFETALNVPGAPESWGYSLVIVGAIGLYATLALKMQTVFWAMMGIALWFTFFTLSLLHTAVTNPEAATTGIITYGTLAIACVVLGAVYRFSAKERT